MNKAVFALYKGKCFMNKVERALYKDLYKEKYLKSKIVS